MRVRLALAVVLLGSLHAGNASAQTVWHYWCAPLAAYYPTVQTCPIPWQRVGQEADAAPSSPDSDQQSSSYQQGAADWRALQAWFRSQTGDSLAGANYWAANRSRAGHGSCEAAAELFSGDAGKFTAGCEEVKSRLGPIDAKRLSDPEYRAGFNDEATQLPIAVNANSDAQPSTPSATFSNYPAGPAYTGPHVPPDLSDPDKHLFRTRITEASAQPPNFAGRYVISVWGCGTGCAQGVAVNAANGKALWLPPSFIVEPLDADRFQYRIDSRLLIVNGYENDADSGPYTPRCYVLDDGAQPQLVRIDCLVSTTADNAPSPTPAASILSAAPTPVTEPSPPEPADAVVTSPSIEPPTQTATETTSQSSSINPIWIIVGVAAALYFLPSLIASQKGRFLATFVANLAFGWTLLGWIIVLIWALMPSSKPRVMVIENDGTLRPKGRAGR